MALLLLVENEMYGLTSKYALYQEYIPSVMVLLDEIHFVESIATEKETYNWALIRSPFRLYKELHVYAIFNLKATDSRYA